MSMVKRWIVLALLGLVLALGGCGPAGEMDGEAESEQVLPGEGGEGLEGDEGD
jgi:hypothetical protein